MASKSWTATDLQLGTLTVRATPHPDTENPAINFQQRYEFLDSGDLVISQIAGGKYVDNIELGDIPSTVLDALQTINNWLYQRCLDQEGM